MGGIVAHKKGGEKVEIVLGDGAGGVIGVGVFAAQTGLCGQSEGELTSKGGIECPHMLVVVEGVVDRTAVDGVIATILTTYNLVEHIVGVGECPLGTRLHHTASQHHALVVDFGAVDVDDVVVVEGEVIDRVVFYSSPYHRRKDGQIVVVLDVVGVGDIMEIVEVGSQFCSACRIEHVGVIEVGYILVDGVFGDRLREDLLCGLPVDLLVGKTGVVPLTHVADGHGEDNPEGVAAVDEPVVAHLQGEVARIDVAQRAAELLVADAVQSGIGCDGKVGSLLVRLFGELEEGVGLLGPKADVGAQVMVEEELGAFSPTLHLAVESHTAQIGGEGAVKSLREMVLGTDIDNAALAFGVVFCRRVGDDLNAVNARAVGAAQQRFETLAVKVRGPSVNPHGDRLAIEQHIAVLVDADAGRLAQQVEGIAALRKSAFRNIHHQLVHLLFHNGRTLHHLHGLQHGGIGSKGDGWQRHLRLVGIERLVVRLIADK